MLGFSVDTAAFRELDVTIKRLARASEKGLDRVANLASRQKQRQLAKTYARPIPKGKNGNPKWKRSGELARRQRVTATRGHRRLSPTGKAIKYEGRVAELPTGADNINRSNPAAEKTMEIIEPQIEPVFEQEIKNELGL